MRKSYTAITFVVLDTLLLATCVRASAVTTLPPSTISRPVTVTIRVFRRAPENTTPIPAAIVTDDHQRVTQTDGAGVARLPEDTECRLRLDVKAEGFEPFWAETDRLTAAETWTFYLERKR